MTDAVELVAPGMSVTLDLGAGGRAISWTIDGDEVLGARSEEAVENGMYPMAPWAGRVRDNTLRFEDDRYPLRPSHGEWALHGTVLAGTSRLVSHELFGAGADATVVTDLGPDWPWAGRLTSIWRVRADAVTTVLTLESGGDVFPGVIGWHPWFNRRLGGGHPARWHLAGPRLAERLSGFRLTGALIAVDHAREVFDDAFLVEEQSGSIEWPGQLRIDVSSSHPWFVVFDELPGFICIEPQTGPPNGINDGLVGPINLVGPGQALELTNEWRVTRGLQAG